MAQGHQCRSSSRPLPRSPPCRSDPSVLQGAESETVGPSVHLLALINSPDRGSTSPDVGTVGRWTNGKRCIASSNKCIATSNKKLLGAPWQKIGGLDVPQMFIRPHRLNHQNYNISDYWWIFGNNTCRPGSSGIDWIFVSTVDSRKLGMSLILLTSPNTSRCAKQLPMIHV